MKTSRALRNEIEHLENLLLWATKSPRQANATATMLGHQAKHYIDMLSPDKVPEFRKRASLNLEYAYFDVLDYLDPKAREIALLRVFGKAEPHLVADGAAFRAAIRRAHHEFKHAFDFALDEGLDPAAPEHLADLTDRILRVVC